MPTFADTLSRNAHIDDDQLHYDTVSQMINSYVVSMTLHAAVELDLFQIIANAGYGARMSSSDIAAVLPTSSPDAPAMLDRILYLLASHAVLTCTIDDRDNVDEPAAGNSKSKRLYGLAPISKYFVRNQDGVSVAPLLTLNQNKAMHESWYKIKDAVLEGGVPFEKLHEMHPYQYAGKDPEFNRVFNSAMYNHTTMTVKELLECYKGFEDLSNKTLVDVGGGLGTAISMITAKYPKIKGINYDLPHVVQSAKPCPGVEHIGGDMFESIPKGDALFIKSALHNWTDDRCIKMLKNCWKALPVTGKLIVVETVIPEMPDTGNTTQAISRVDMIMLTTNPGGRERTREDFLFIAKEAGFSDIKFVSSFFSIFWVMEFIKNKSLKN